MPNYRKVSAAEKYAELAAAGEERPAGKFWQADNRHPAGGRWRWNFTHSEEARARKRALNRRYRDTPKGRISTMINNDRNNPRILTVGGIYLGTI